jgi:hypothetical protein
VRYLVIDTSKWLPGRKVLVPPEAIVTPWHHQPAVAVELTTERIRSSPDIDTVLPVSRLRKELLHRHLQWTPYWDPTIVPIPPMPPPDPALAVEEDRQAAGRRGVSGRRYAPKCKRAGWLSRQGEDGEVGHVKDLLLDDDLRRILFLVGEVKGSLSGKKMLVGPSVITRVDWATSTVHVNANRQGLKNAQEYNPAG